MALPAELQELAASVSNWGRWGDDDERGTQNLIDDAALRRGLAAVGSGRHLSLAIPLDQTSPQEGGAPGPHRPAAHDAVDQPELHGRATATPSFNDDTVVMAMSAGTHIDALGHVTYGGFMYNGFPDSTVTAGGGPDPVRRRQDRPDHEPRRAARRAPRPRASSGSSPATPSPPTTSTPPSSWPRSRSSPATSPACAPARCSCCTRARP